MDRPVAVITDATSPGYVFPHWVRYYGSQFGLGNLYVVTYRGMARRFPKARFGAVVEMDFAYSNVRRATAIADLVATLLRTHGAVIRCDVDEFLVPDPERSPSLADYVQKMPFDHATAMGLDVVELASEAMLDYTSGLLAQRRFAAKSAAYCKTSIVKAPVRWSVGFHHASVRPRFDHLYLFHMKFADLAMRRDFFDRMRGGYEPGSAELALYDRRLDELTETRALFQRLPRRTGPQVMRDPHYQHRFEQSVAPPGPGHAFYRAMDGTEGHLSEIPPAFLGAF